MGRIPHPFPTMKYAIILAGIGKMLDLPSYDSVIEELERYVRVMIANGETVSELPRHLVVCYDCNCFACNGRPVFYEAVFGETSSSLRETSSCSVALAMAKGKALTET